MAVFKCNRFYRDLGGKFPSNVFKVGMDRVSYRPVASRVKYLREYCCERRSCVKNIKRCEKNSSRRLTRGDDENPDDEGTSNSESDLRSNSPSQR